MVADGRSKDFAVQEFLRTQLLFTFRSLGGCVYVTTGLPSSVTGRPVAVARIFAISGSLSAVRTAGILKSMAWLNEKMLEVTQYINTPCTPT